MTNKQQKEWYEHDKKLIIERLGITGTNFNKFRSLGKRLRKIYCDNCNGYLGNDGKWSDELEAEAEAKENKLTLAVKNLATDCGLYIYLQTDPRGATIYLDTKEIPENSYNNAYCIF